ncbi:MAG: Gfo/Idh/MocA family oxidoreductase [Gemmatimonadota bacterium]|nr:Gfo/Idh/MocA family oxidoreductase [Gemmatimonadota bacterium]
MKRICLVGCGTIARLHAKNLSGAAELFFCSRSEESARRFNVEFRGSGSFPRVEDALASPGIDAVVIASPPEFHKDQVIRALSAGKDVMVEKPMCVTPEEVEAVGAAVASHPEALLMVAENYYYKPLLKRIRALTVEQRIGDIRSIYVKKMFTQATAGWKRQYGALLEGGIHFVALISAVFECAPERVNGRFPERREGEPERTSVVELTYPGNVTAELRYSWDTKSRTKGMFQHSRIHGTNGQIVFESNGLYVLTKGHRGVRLYFPGISDLMGYREMTRDFLRCVDDRNQKPYSDFPRARRDLRIVFDAYRW